MMMRFAHIYISLYVARSLSLFLSVWISFILSLSLFVNRPVHIHVENLNKSTLYIWMNVMNRMCAKSYMQNVIYQIEKNAKIKWKDAKANKTKPHETDTSIYSLSESKQRIDFQCSNTAKGNFQWEKKLYLLSFCCLSTASIMMETAYVYGSYRNTCLLCPHQWLFFFIFSRSSQLKMQFFTFL